MGKTSIEWCDHTVNPIKARDMRTGKVGHHCVKISPGCKNCYASAMQPMRFGLPEFGDPKRHVQSFLDRKALKQVLTRKAPTTYFWEDMSDMFGDWQQEKWIDACFAVMALTPHHKHLILTKRTERMAHYLTGHNAHGKMIQKAALEVLDGKPLPATGPVWPLPNVRLGASVENQEMANLRIPQLLRCPAAGHFLSIEPQLGPVTIKFAACACPSREEAFKNKTHVADCPIYRLAGRARPLFSLVIVGGESGKGARPFNLQWARSIVRQCGDLDVNVFVKQLGSYPTLSPVGTKEWDEKQKPIRLKLKSRKGGNMDEWEEDLQVREPML